jgi:hypothetical protein
MGAEDAAIVVRFTAADNAEAQDILMAIKEAIGDRDAAAWMCIRDSLDALNDTLSGLGWPPSADGA